MNENTENPVMEITLDGTEVMKTLDRIEERINQLISALERCEKVVGVISTKVNTATAQ